MGRGCLPLRRDIAGTDNNVPEGTRAVAGPVLGSSQIPGSEAEPGLLTGAFGTCRKAPHLPCDESAVEEQIREKHEKPSAGVGVGDSAHREMGVSPRIWACRLCHLGSYCHRKGTPGRSLVGQ